MEYVRQKKFWKHPSRRKQYVLTLLWFVCFQRKIHQRQKHLCEKFSSETWNRRMQFIFILTLNLEGSYIKDKSSCVSNFCQKHETDTLNLYLHLFRNWRCSTVWIGSYIWDKSIAWANTVRNKKETHANCSYTKWEIVSASCVWTCSWDSLACRTRLALLALTTLPPAIAFPNEEYC